jgi:hypothetical protein
MASSSSSNSLLSHRGEELLELPSPSHIGLAGPPSQHHHSHHLQQHHAHQHNHHVDGFSPEDIHHLLGDVLGDEEDDDDEDEGHSDQGNNGGNHYSLHNIHHPNSGKRQRSSALMMEGDMDEGIGNPSNVNDKSVIRTERKRTREKQRRSDVNKQFQELTGLLRRLETEDPDEFSNLPPYSPANRVELMGRTVQLITVLYGRSKKRKLEIADLQQRLEAAQKAGEETAAKLKEAMMAPQNVGGNKVMMMVPMLINTGAAHAGAPSTGDGSQQQHATAAFPAASAAAAMSYQPWMSNFMGMPTEAQAMMGAAAMAASAPSAAHHAMQMPFFMPMTAPMPSPAATIATPPTAPAPSATPASTVQPAAPNTNLDPGTSSGDLKQDAKVGSNLAHCA